LSARRGVLCFSGCDLRGIAPELVFIVLGLLLVLVGLSVWFGWWVAVTVDGILLALGGAWSAASKD
jgi:hypothetical protein